MGYQIIKQPDDKFMIWSSFTDSIIYWDASEKEVRKWFMARAVRSEKESMNRLMEAVKDDPRKAYYQFTKTFEQAIEKSRDKSAKKWFKKHPIDTAPKDG